MNLKNKTKNIMETTLVNTDYTYNKVELENKIENTIKLIKDWSKRKNYRIEGTPTNKLDDFQHLSKTTLKKINKYIIGLEKHITMRRSNMFFHLLNNLYTHGNNPVRIKYSEKEEKIQKARKEMLKAKELYETLLSVYKTEKGNYYKK